MSTSDSEPNPDDLIRQFLSQFQVLTDLAKSLLEVLNKKDATNISTPSLKNVTKVLNVLASTEIDAKPTAENGAVSRPDGSTQAKTEMLPNLRKATKTDAFDKKVKNQVSPRKITDPKLTEVFSKPSVNDILMKNSSNKALEKYKLNDIQITLVKNPKEIKPMPSLNSPRKNGSNSESSFYKSDLAKMGQLNMAQNVTDNLKEIYQSKRRRKPNQFAPNELVPNSFGDVKRENYLDSNEIEVDPLEICDVTLTTNPTVDEDVELFEDSDNDEAAFDAEEEMNYYDNDVEEEYEQDFKSEPNSESFDYLNSSELAAYNEDGGHQIAMSKQFVDKSSTFSLNQRRRMMKVRNANSRQHSLKTRQAFRFNKTTVGGTNGTQQAVPKKNLISSVNHQEIDFQNKNESGAECQMCGKVMSNRASLNRHIQVVHTNIKPFACGLCGKKFSLKANMKKHDEEVHKRSLMTECHLCGKILNCPRNLRLHMRTYHEK